MSARPKTHHSYKSPSEVDKEMQSQLRLSLAITKRKEPRFFPVGKEVEGGYVGKLQGQPKREK